MFMGVACYADDVVLIGPCQQAMQLMLSTVQEFAEKNNISFSTDPDPNKSKSKCIFVVGKRRNLVKPAPLELCGHTLPLVKSAVYLGHELHESGTMDHDAVVKRAKFIDRSVEVRSMFSWAAPADILKVLKTYCSAFYGSMLWDLGGEKAGQVYRSWNTAVKLTWSCPRWTRTFLLQQVLSCGETSAMTDILSRYSKFCKGLRTSVSPEIRVLFNLAARDLQSTTAKNIRFVQEQSRTDPWTVSPGTLKQELHSASLVVVPVQEEWKLRCLAGYSPHTACGGQRSRAGGQGASATRANRQSCKIKTETPF